MKPTGHFYGLTPPRPLRQFDTPAARQEFERHMERRRLEEQDQEALEQFRRNWVIGSDVFRQECLQQMEGKVGENHPGQTRLETAEAKAERILAEELARLNWTQSELAAHQKSHPVKLALAARLRQETTLSVKQIAERLHLGSPKGARTNLHKIHEQGASRLGPTHPEYPMNYETNRAFLRSDPSDNQLVIDKWLEDWDQTYTGTIRLAAGKRYRIVYEYFESGGGANTRLEWSSPSQPREVVPSARLFPAPAK